LIQTSLLVCGHGSREILDVLCDLLVDAVKSLGGLELVGRVDYAGDVGLLDGEAASEGACYCCISASLLSLLGRCSFMEEHAWKKGVLWWG